MMMTRIGDVLCDFDFSTALKRFKSTHFPSAVPFHIDFQISSRLGKATFSS